MKSPHRNLKSSAIDQLQSRAAIAEGTWKDQGPAVTGNGSAHFIEIPISSAPSDHFFRVERRFMDE